MEIRIRPAWPVSDIGGKPNQEDRIYPYKETLTDKGLPTDTRCFVLCDGMGGHEHGEVAAEIVSHTLQPSLVSTAGKPDIMTADRFNKALKATYAELDKMAVSEGKRPGTTMTCVYLAENGVFVAHIGDSRIYQIRPGVGVIFRTLDHSLVNELVKAGEITEKEAIHHPRRNVITRAMQPGLETPFRADSHVITDIKAGDYFFMCSDGVLENLTDEKLVEILSKDISDKEKLNEIYYVCLGRTRDNFSAVLIPIASVSGIPLPTPAPKPIPPQPVKVAAQGPVATRSTKGQPLETKKARKKSKTLIWIGIIAVIAAIVGAYFIGFKTASEDNQTESKPQSVQTDKTIPQNGTKAEPKPTVKDDDDEDDEDEAKEDDEKNKPEEIVGEITEKLEDVAESKQQSQNSRNDKLGNSALGPNAIKVRPVKRR